MFPRKLVEFAFRRWWILAAPIVLLPILTMAIMEKPPQYRATATVWVSTPSGVDPGPFGRNQNPYLSPAQNRTQVLNDLLGSESFRDAVATSAGITPSSFNLRSHLTVGAVGVNAIGIWGTADDPGRAQALVAALITQYRERTRDEVARETATVVDYYTAQLGLAQEEFTNRQAALTAYLQANPRLGDSRTSDPEYLRLLARVDAQNRIADGLRNSLQDAQRNAASSPQALEAVFSVLDEPKLPSSPEAVSSTAKYGYPFAALVFGVLIASSYLYLLYRTDHTIQSSEDLADVGVPVLGFVPEIHPAGLANLGPMRWIPNTGRRDFARRIAASISGGTVK